MSLDVSLQEMRPCEVYSRNISHDLIPMAQAAGLYEPLWRPEEMKPPVMSARALIPHLERGIERLREKPEEFQKLNPANNRWDRYEGFLEFVQAYLEACRELPNAAVRVCR
jgi:hypothetical protein